MKVQVFPNELQSKGFEQHIALRVLRESSAVSGVWLGTLHPQLRVSSFKTIALNALRY